MWLALLTAAFVHAEILEVTGVHYRTPPVAPSCGLLKRREAERQKVIREFARLRGDSVLWSNYLILNKMFLPSEAWRDEIAGVSVTVKMSDEMRAELERFGLDRLYIGVRGPGFVWQSFAYQLPHEMKVEADGEFLYIHYLTYLNVICLERLETPVVEWMPAGEAL